MKIGTDATLRHLILLREKHDRVQKRATKLAHEKKATRDVLVTMLAREEWSAEEAAQMREWGVPYWPQLVHAMGYWWDARLGAMVRKRGQGERTAVYLLRLNGAVQYVGISMYVRVRVSTHRREGRIEFDSVDVIAEFAERRDAMDLEAQLIAQHSPPLNRARPKRVV